jgi:hypothetical protein
LYFLNTYLGSTEKAACDGTARDGNFVRSRKVPFQTHRPTSSLDPCDFKNFPLKRRFSYFQVPFKNGFTARVLLVGLVFAEGKRWRKSIGLP